MTAFEAFNGSVNGHGGGGGGAAAEDGERARPVKRPRRESAADPTAADELITVGVRHQTGEVLHFTIRKSTRLERLFAAFKQKKGLDQNRHWRFLIDGEWINPTQTCLELEIEDQDQIDCMEEMGGD